MNDLLVWKLVSDYCEWFTIFDLATVCSDFYHLFNEEFWRERFTSEFIGHFENTSFPNATFSWKRCFLKMQIIVFRQRLHEYEEMGYSSRAYYDSSLGELMIEYQIIQDRIKEEQKMQQYAYWYTFMNSLKLLCEEYK